VINTEGKVLLVSQGGISWSFPKGHIEENENKLSAAKREIFEESGITDLVLIKELGSYCRTQNGLDGKEDTSVYKEITLFLFTTTENNLNPSDPIIPEARWFNKEDVASFLTHPVDKNFFTSLSW